MTEVVQKRLETMTEEVEEMRRVKLFSSDEIRMIVKRRKEFEHKIYTVSKDLKSYEDYIAYEKCLLKDIRLRRDKLKIAEKRNSIEYRILKRIKFLYERTLQYFSSDISVFFAFIKFCKKLNYGAQAVDTITKMVNMHSDKPEAWKVGASYHAYERKDANTAMMMLLKAIELHKDCKILYKEIIAVEIFSTNHNNIDTNVSLAKLKELMLTIFINIRDCTFWIEILEQLEEHTYTVDIQDMIIEKLLTDYCDNELVWDTLAQRERKGLHYELEPCDEDELGGQTKVMTPRAKLEACFDKYKKGLQRVSEKVKKNLWCLYLDFLIGLQHDTLGGATVLKTSTLKQAFDDAYADGALKEKHYVSWLESISPEEALTVAEKGTKGCPDSEELWLVRLKLQILKGNTTKVDQVFKLGARALKEKGLQLWLSILTYHYSMSRPEYIKLIYQDGVLQPKEISDVFKARFIEFMCLEEGIASARNLYKKLADLKPHSLELHSMMCHLESLQVCYNFVAWEESHELACKQFGRNDVLVWLRYIKFYLHYYKEHPDSSEKILSISNRAEENLPKTLIFEFLTKFSDLKESY